mmetsp:Transcript_30759/g.102477  ORF Transcript_30759/g.102477 Transcript_30759/m.102477 type:complete len:98 (+) Transcript_30759:522-815(+)
MFSRRHDEIATFTSLLKPRQTRENYQCVNRARSVTTFHILKLENTASDRAKQSRTTKLRRLLRSPPVPRHWCFCKEGQPEPALVDNTKQLRNSQKPR